VYKVVITVVDSFAQIVADARAVEECRLMPRQLIPKMLMCYNVDIF